MVANESLKFDNSYFNEFLKFNKTKIKAIIIKNPSISKKDEWYNETFWDNYCKESNNK